MQIEGVPEGYEVVRIGAPRLGEAYIALTGVVAHWSWTHACASFHPIVRKIEKPKKYRPFANAEEFKPHRDQWVRVKANGMVTRPISYVHDRLYIGDIWLYWGDAFLNLEFETGTPFGVEVA